MARLRAVDWIQSGNPVISWGLFLITLLLTALWNIVSGMVAQAHPNAPVSGVMTGLSTGLLVVALGLFVVAVRHSLAKNLLLAHQVRSIGLVVGIFPFAVAAAAAVSAPPPHMYVHTVGEKIFMVPLTKTSEIGDQPTLGLELCFDDLRGLYEEGPTPCRTVHVTARADWASTRLKSAAITHRYHFSPVKGAPNTRVPGFDWNPTPTGVWGRKTVRGQSLWVQGKADGGLHRVAECSVRTGACTVFAETRHGIMIYETPPGVGEAPERWLAFERALVAFLTEIEIC